MVRTLDLRPWAGLWVAVDSANHVRCDAPSLSELLDVLASAEAKLHEDYIKADNAQAFDALREFLPLGDNAIVRHRAAASWAARCFT